MVRQVRRERSESRSCISSEAVTITAHLSPATFQAFDAEVIATPGGRRLADREVRDVRRARAASSARAPRRRSPCTSYRAASAATASSSSRSNDGRSDCAGGRGGRRGRRPRTRARARRGRAASPRPERERRLDDDPPPTSRVDGEERRVDGRVDDDRRRPGSVSARRSSATADITSATSLHPLRLDLPAEAGARRTPANASPSLPGVGVAGVVARDRREQRLADRQREREVHLGDPGRQDVGRVLRPLRAAAEPQELERDVVERVDADGRRS